MNQHDAQASLDDIHRLQDRTREQIVRQSFALPRVVISALGLFTAFAAIDLPRPWNFVGLALGWAVYAGVGIVHEHRASVRRKPTPPEVLFHGGLLACIMVAFIVGRIASFALFDLPSQGLLSQAAAGATVAALAYVAATPVNRSLMKAIVQQDGRVA
ncbi:hypothetical protein [Nonomuraea harbinensis]|uniref:Uncharacterized protein n=1 Tax=Nonomuraea harbinensis TaxID=1286938 RepID=A0ABW1BUK4_9ACTN|nr:hypothetical protein [Nonomuraea harbinensis]